jgi:hypothetical protein
LQLFNFTSTNLYIFIFASSFCFIIVSKQIKYNLIMKKMNLKIALAALLFAVGTLGLSAQGMRGGGNGGNGGLGGGIGIGGTGCGTYTSLLTADQQAQLLELNVAFQADMLELATARLAATTVAAKLEIFQLMNALRVEHQAQVKTLLESFGITVTTGTGTRGSGMTGTGRRGRRG